MRSKSQKNTHNIEVEESGNLKFVHKRSLGQNFLTSDIVPGWMVEAAKVTTSDTILEIGPGTGRLTEALLKTGARVIAVEADIRAVEELNKTFEKELKSKQLTLHHGDAREINPISLGLSDKKFKVVANIPYYLSGFLLRSLLESEIQPTNLTFLIQKELAVRIARDKKESILALSVKVFGEPKLYKTVSPGHFYPMPKVDSAILTIDNIQRDNFKEITTEHFFAIIHLGLGKKRKQLIANLSEKYNRSDLISIFESLNISLTIRGEDISLPIWLKLSKKLLTT